MSIMVIDHPSAYLPGYILGALAADKHRVVEQHLQNCVVCRNEAYALREWLLRSEGEAPRASVRTRLMSRVNGRHAES
jgi:hypothetical protein